MLSRLRFYNNNALFLVSNSLDTNRKKEMKKVFKYKLEILDYQEIELPIDSQILSVQMQHKQLCLWALVNPSNPKQIKTIRVAGTGHPIIDTNLKFIGTVQQLKGHLIWHVFEVET